MMYGWAHLFAIWDALRGRRMAWQPTQSSQARTSRTRRFWVGIGVWGVSTAAVWVVSAFWRLITLEPVDFAMLFGSGLFYALMVGRILVQPRAGAPA
jgi:cellulose synthase (UDP-forming)